MTSAFGDPEEGELDPVEFSFPLRDDGVGADRIANDGVYASYSSFFPEAGRYALSCHAEGQDGITSVRETSATRSSVSAPAGTPPLCCGVDADPRGLAVRRPTGAFDREVAGGSLKVGEANATADTYAPSKVRDLSAKLEVEGEFAVLKLEFTSPGDDFDEGNGEKKSSIT